MQAIGNSIGHSISSLGSWTKSHPVYATAAVALTAICTYAADRKMKMHGYNTEKRIERGIPVSLLAGITSIAVAIIAQKTFSFIGAYLSAHPVMGLISIAIALGIFRGILREYVFHS